MSNFQAVRAALSETHVIQQTKNMLEEEGVNLAALERAARGDTQAETMKRSDRVILAKNLPFAVCTGEKFASVVPVRSNSWVVLGVFFISWSLGDTR